MTPEVQKAVLANLDRHEGNVRYIYPDSKGNPTVGKGHLLPNQASALKLPFRTPDGLPAAPARILSAWNYVKSYRQPYRQISLLQSDVDALALEDLGTFEFEMNSIFPHNERFPVPVQIALWDMLYNLGSFAKFPNLVAAVHAGDWARAAVECTRLDIGAARNKDTKEQFLAGLTLTPSASERLA